MAKIPDNRLASEEYRAIFEAASDGLVVYDIGLDAVVEANPAACAMHRYTRNEFIGLNPGAFMLPEHHARFMEQVRAVGTGRRFDVSAVHLRKDGSAFHVEVRRSAVQFRQRPCLLSILRDVSERIQKEQNLDARIESQIREQATLLAISHTLASTLEFQPGLILDQLREIVEYNHCGLFALEDSTLVTLALRGTPALEGFPPLRIRLPLAEDHGMLFHGRKPVRIADVWEQQTQARSLRTSLSEGASVLIQGMHSWMWVPLAVKGRLLGGVAVAHAKQDFYTPHHADLAVSVANQAAITMVNTELNRQAQELAVLEERQKLARNLHDAINQSLFSAGLIAEVLPRLWDRDQAEARRSLDDVRKLTRGAMAEMRALLAELRPSTLIDAELGDLLGLLANAFAGRTNIPARVTVLGQGTLPADVQVAIYRICQEALNNIARHAAATEVEIRLEHKEDAVGVDIRDDGQGFDPEHISSGHYGLSMMRERAEGVGARLTIASRPGRGTKLSLRWAQNRQKDAPGKEYR